MIQKIINRFELKYKISLYASQSIIENIKPFMELDSYVKNNYDYEVRSLYFDSLFGKSFFEKIDGIKFRRKFRVRYYPDFQDGKNDYAFIELKTKYDRIIVKNRIKVPMDEALKIIDVNSSMAKKFYEKATQNEKETLREIWFLQKRYNFKPVCVVCYNRQPYVSKFDKKFRITFDTNVKIRKYNFDLYCGDGSYYVVPPNIVIIEVKFNNFIPKWAINILQRNECIQQRMSKFADGLIKARLICFK